MSSFSQTIDGIQEILTICPCCGQVFRLVEGKFLFPTKMAKTCEYQELIGYENKYTEEKERLDSSEERFNARFEKQREELIVQGGLQAKKKLKKIDPVFSSKNIDPQDVKVIFDPVEYVIFHGLSSENGVNCVELVSRCPKSKPREVLVKSMDQTINKGNIGFETLHLRDDGTFEIRRV